MEKKYVIDREANKVSRTIMSKGQEFTATATCDGNDKFLEEIGKAIVDYRLELMQRKRDLANTNQFIDFMKYKHERMMKEVGHADTSKHYMISIQNAAEERNSQYKNIKYCEMRLKELTSGDYVQAVLSLLDDKKITINSANKFIKEWAAKK